MVDGGWWIQGAQGPEGSWPPFRVIFGFWASFGPLWPPQAIRAILRTKVTTDGRQQGVRGTSRVGFDGFTQGYLPPKSDGYPVR